jgi:hypothetical protein
MQPDELEAQCCRKDKIAMAKSPKSWCCKGTCYKVDAVEVKGLYVGSLFMSWGQTRLLADHDTVYWHLKAKLTKNIKGHLQESKNWLSTRCQSWIDPPPPCFPFGVLLRILPSSCLLVDSLASHQLIALTHWPTCQGWIPLTIGELHWTSSPSSSQSIVLCFHQLILFVPFDLFFQKTVSTHAP